MNTKMADGAAQRCVAQIGEALFGQPGLTLDEIANRLRELRGDGGPLLADMGNPISPSPVGQGDALVTDAMVYAAEDAYANSKQDNLHESFREAIAAALAARQPSDDQRKAQSPQGLSDDSDAPGDRQQVGQQAMYQVRPRCFVAGTGWREVSKREYDDHGSFPGYPEREWERHILYAAPPAQAVDSQAALIAEERAHGETIDKRDRYHDVADELAAHIASITGVDIGDHSSANCPWQNAIEAAEEYTPALAVDLGQFRVAVMHAYGLIENNEMHAKLGELLDLIDSNKAVQP